MVNLPDVQKHLLECMVVFDDFCKKENIDYSILGGTLLGAVRHKGFIPWDDDLDVALLREDYERIIANFRSKDGRYAIRHFGVDSSYIYPYAKLCNNEIIVEEEFYKPFQCGLWIDIFPIDYTFENYYMRKMHFSVIRFLRYILIFKTKSYKNRKKWMFLLEIPFLFLSLNFISYLDNFFVVKLPKYLGLKKYVANFYGAWGEKESIPLNIFKEKKSFVFCGFYFKGLCNYDYWLSKVYGEYMELPPVEKRKPSHIGRFISGRNLNSK